MKFIFLLACLPLFATSPKFLHVSFHAGCLAEMAFIADSLGISLEQRNMRLCPSEEFDGCTDHPGRRFLITEAMANEIWKQNKPFFESFDGYIVSDTAPLSRIFLQNAPEKPLIIWICNRFDFPWSSKRFSKERSYYRQIENALSRKNVSLIAYTPYEIIHAERNRQLFGIQKIIKPSGGSAHPFYQSLFKTTYQEGIPQVINKPSTFFVRDYANENRLHIEEVLTSLGISFYKGPYIGASDLKGFKAMIHIPFVMSNFFLFEVLSQGVPLLIPSKAFLTDLLNKEQVAFCYCAEAPRDNSDIFAYSEWYNEEFKDLFVYFDSWEDLKEKVTKTDFEELSKRILVFSHNHQNRTIAAWREIFHDFYPSLQI